MVPSKSHAILCRNAGEPDVMHWAERTTPVPAPDEVLIKVAAAGVNRVDILQRRGKYPPPPGASDILGMEVSGEVVAIGNKVQRWKMGDKVCALLASGGYVEYVAAPEMQCLPVPQNMSMAEVAALPECIITVWANVFEAAGLKPGETVLVHGGSSGIGTTAIQMIKLHGGKIIVTAGSDEKCAACRKVGADAAINYKDEDFVSAVIRETNQRGVDIVLDMIGGDYVARNLSVLAPFGRHVSISTQQGRVATIDLRDIMQKRLTITGSTLRGRSQEEKACLVKEVEAKVWPWVLSGQLKPLVSHSFPIKKVAEAHKVMESSAHIGKIVLEIDV